jgi:hypothetical protein
MKVAFCFFIVSFSVLASPALTQELSPKQNKFWDRFSVEPSIEVQYRKFERNTFLGDTYALALGYRMNLNLIVRGYPGIGFYSDGQNASIEDTFFMGGFFKKASTSGFGSYIFYKFNLNKKIALSPEFGVGQLRLIQGERPAKFFLNYRHVVSGLGITYSIVKEKFGIYDMNLIVKVGYGTLNGKNIVINPSDQNYVRRSTDFHGGLGIQFAFF